MVTRKTFELSLASLTAEHEKWDAKKHEAQTHEAQNAQGGERHVARPPVTQALETQTLGAQTGTDYLFFSSKNIIFGATTLFDQQGTCSGLTQAELSLYGFNLAQCATP